MSWLGFGGPPAETLSRLDKAVASNLAAQSGVQRAGMEAADAAVRQRREAIMQRRQTRLAARKLRVRALHTSEVRSLVDDMLRGFETEPEKERGERPC